jgi:CBS domain-containing protein
MTTRVVTVSPEASLKDAAELLVANRISGLPVVDSQDRVLGVLSEAEILFKERPRPEEPGLLRRLFDHGHAATREKLEATSVREAMTAPAITIGPDASVSRVAEKMLEAGVRRLPVLGKGGRLLGIVTRADLVRAFVRSDDEIAAEVRDLIGLFSVPPEAISVTVDEGTVRLAGTVDSKLAAEAIRSLVRRVSGVVDVVGELRWRWDPELSHGRDLLGPSRAAEEGDP